MIDVQPRRVDVHGRQRRLQPRNVALMVGAPDVDHAVEAAHEELVVVVGDVRREVGGVAGRAHEDVVLVLAEGAAREPDGALFLRHVAPLAQ